MQETGKVTLRVHRFNPTVDSAPWFKVYQLPWSEGLSMLEAVRCIYYKLDNSLSFRNYHCGRGLCRACLMKIDGKTQRGCYFILKKDSSYLVEPPDGYPILRDLTVDFGVPIRLKPEGDIYWVKEGVRIEEEGAVVLKGGE